MDDCVWEEDTGHQGLDIGDCLEAKLEDMYQVYVDEGISPIIISSRM